MKRNYNNNSGRNSSPRYNDSGEIDRYNYVNRDIYSSSNRSGKKGGRYGKPKKSGTGKKIAIVFTCLVLLAAVGVLVYAGIMFGRINRKNVNTDSFVEQPSSAPTWSVKSDDKVTNILLIGADQLEDGIQRSDSMMLVSIDNKTKTLRLVSFLRDLYVQIPTVGKNKLNASFSNGGAGLTMQTLENNFRINIDKYIMTDFNNFANIIDKMGGIDLTMTKEEAAYMNKIKGCNLTAGKNHLRGTLALYFSRMRYLDSDFGRTGRQRQVIMAMMEKIKKMNIVDFSSVMYDYLPLVTTNLNNQELLYLCSIGLNVTKYPVKTMHVPANDTYKEPTIDGVGQVLDPDLEQNCSKLREFLYGENGDGTSAVSDQP